MLASFLHLNQNGPIPNVIWYAKYFNRQQETAANEDWQYEPIKVNNLEIVPYEQCCDQSRSYWHIKITVWKKSVNTTGNNSLKFTFILYIDIRYSEWIYIRKCAYIRSFLRIDNLDVEPELIAALQVASYTIYDCQRYYCYLMHRNPPWSSSLPRLSQPRVNLSICSSQENPSID